MYYVKLLIEAIVIGISVAGFSGLVMYAAQQLPQWEESEGEFKYYAASFASGAILHLIFEFTRLNAYYIRNGASNAYVKGKK